ncbi:hypothetical protein MNBD_ALPHA09-1624 [hydrothermal vent metagenome]|uniref:Uncharacterized protein n=1 Tax=hydrothermal vent metagenome TaxID=652676 RepID=A0A3B0TLB3_9ZZZZ
MLLEAVDDFLTLLDRYRSVDGIYSCFIKSKWFYCFSVTPPCFTILFPCFSRIFP